MTTPFTSILLCLSGSRRTQGTRRGRLCPGRVVVRCCASEHADRLGEEETSTLKNLGVTRENSENKPVFIMRFCGYLAEPRGLVGRRPCERRQKQKRGPAASEAWSGRSTNLGRSRRFTWLRSFETPRSGGLTDGVASGREESQAPRK